MTCRRFLLRFQFFLSFFDTFEDEIMRAANNPEAGSTETLGARTGKHCTVEAQDLRDGRADRNATLPGSGKSAQSVT